MRLNGRVTVCDNLTKKRIVFTIKKAARLLSKDGETRIVYLLDGKPRIMVLASYLDTDLDANGATRVFVTGYMTKGRESWRCTYDPRTDKFIPKKKQEIFEAFYQ
jgi:hypothetical protein